MPCYYVPGNHESYTASGQGTLANWVAEFGAPYRTFDHKGTRFILLNSALGNLRSSDFAQLPMLKAALDDAATDAVGRQRRWCSRTTRRTTRASSTRRSSPTAPRSQLIEKLLTDFREASDKGVAMVGSHAQIANVQREQGVAYIVHPSSGKAPYGTPDRGGFTGWMRWTVDRSEKASQQWITADVRAFAQSATLDAPEALEVGDSAQLEGSIVQPSGVLPGSRVVPLRYPMSVRWSGSDNLAIGTDVGGREGRRQGRDPRPGDAQAHRAAIGRRDRHGDRRLDARVHRRGVDGADHDLEGHPHPGHPRRRGGHGRRHRPGHARADAGRAGVASARSPRA